MRYLGILIFGYFIIFIGTSLAGERKPMSFLERSVEVDSTENQKYLDEGHPVLEAFAFNGFLPPIPNLRVDGHITLADIEKRFGAPVRKSSVKRKGRHPTIINDHITWEYPGLLIEITGAPVGNRRSFWIDQITLTSGRYQLTHHLRIGDNKEKYIAKFGPPPQVFRKNWLHYSAEAFDIINGADIGGSVSISINYDDKGIVRKIVWSAGNYVGLE